ncbi:hypothetical protein FA048_17725 [Pedobacter polaris]|uniref:HTTM-like domain-containing protein n=1 Tax=Pedobacter polaris TaxID=2571273 RepID=A0A4U1CJN0_9SPHI|nr:hypothetical protein [Pedobacter polaris]TKC05563.1 hypothetical protein FA048_17725 [Pedobacter polaris]
MNSYKIKSVLKDNVFYNITYCYSANQLEVFRILVAAFAIISMFTLVLDYDVFFAPNGIVNWEVSNANALWFECHPQKIADFLNVPPQYVMITILTLYFLSLITLLLGVWTRLSAIVCLITFTLITNVMSSFAFGVDIYQSVCFFFLTIFPTGYSLSLIKKDSYHSLSEIKQICVRVLQLYLIITYMSAGFEKAFMLNWWNGRFIYFLSNDPTIMTTNFFPKDQSILFYAFFGIMVVFMESLYFILVWFKKTRLYIIVIIISMHLFIGLFMDLLFFGVLLIILNIVCWYPAIFVDFKIKEHDKSI